MVSGWRLAVGGWGLAVSCLVSAPCCTAGEAKPSAQVSGYERLAAAMLPKEKLYRAQGFFGPVVKKYQPTFQRFQTEFQAAKNKRAVIEKYLPDAESALADARAMKVPSKYEAEKAEYLRLADAFMSALRFSVALGK